MELRASGRRFAVSVFAAVLVFYLVGFFFIAPKNPEDARGDGSYHWILGRGDGHYMYLMTLSMVLDGDLDLRNQFKLAGDPFSNGAMRTPTGHHWIYPAGTAFLQAPFFIIAQGCAWVADRFGAGIPLHGYTLFHQRITFLGSLLAGFAAVVLSYRLARRYVSEVAALAGAAAVGLGTAVTFYAALMPAYAHSWTAFSVALLLERWDASRGRHDLRRWALMGALVGLCVLTREQEIVFALVPAGELLFAAFERRRDVRFVLHMAAYGVLAGVTALAVASPQLLTKWTISGSLTDANLTPNYLNWVSPFFWETLFASRNGLFVWTPVAYLGTIGLFFGNSSRVRYLGTISLLLFFGETWINGSAFGWWSDASFSNRRFVDCTILFALGLAFAIERVRGLVLRFPRLAPAAALVLLLAPFIVCNLELAKAVARGQQPMAQPLRIADLYTGIAKRLNDDISEIGSPPTWPYSWLWALRYNVSPSRFDTIVGSDHLYIDPKKLTQLGARDSDVVKLAGSSFGGNGVGAPGVMDGTLTWAVDGSRLLVFLHITKNVSLELRARVAVPTTLTINGDAHPLKPSDDFVVVPIDASLRYGTNSFAFSCPPDTRPGCVAVDTLTFVFAR